MSQPSSPTPSLRKKSLSKRKEVDKDVTFGVEGDDVEMAPTPGSGKDPNKRRKSGVDKEKASEVENREEESRTDRQRALGLGVLQPRARSSRHYTSSEESVRTETDKLGIFYLRAVGQDADRRRVDTTSAFELLNTVVNIKKKYVLMLQNPFTPEWQAEILLRLDVACYPKLALILGPTKGVFLDSTGNGWLLSAAPLTTTPPLCSFFLESAGLMPDLESLNLAVQSVTSAKGNQPVFNGITSLQIHPVGLARVGRLRSIGRILATLVPRCL